MRYCTRCVRRLPGFGKLLCDWRATVERLSSDPRWRSRAILDVICWLSHALKTLTPQKGRSHVADRVLVTGGAGYIGSVVTAQLLARGCEVIVCDNLSHGSQKAVPAGAKLIVADTADRAALDCI